MRDQARHLLDELLGSSRNLIQDEIDDLNVPENCVFHSIGICPFKSLENTKCDIGKCSYKEHKLVPMKFVDKKILEKNERYLLSICKNIICELEIRKKNLYDIDQTKKEQNETFGKIENLLRNGFIEDAFKLSENFQKTELKEKNVICDVCAIKIPNCLNSKEYETHLEGKLHLSYTKIRQVCEDLLYKYEKNKKVYIPQHKIKEIANKMKKNSNQIQSEK